MHGKCKWCGRHFSQGGVCPSSWGFLKRNAVSSRGYDSNDIYCSEKCRAEAEAGSDESNDDDSSSSSATSEPTLSPGCSAVLGKLVTGVLLLLGLVIVLAVIFGPEEENVNDKEQMMKLWGEHLEKRCAAFAEGLSEESVEARGLKNYTWDEWMDFKRNGQKVAATQSTKSNEPSLRDQWLAHMDKRHKMSASGMPDSEIEKAGYPNLTYDEFKEFKKKKAEEAELKRLNARLAELEGKGKSGGQQNASAPRAARHSSSFDVARDGDTAIVTVTSEWGRREDAWQAAYRAAVKGAVSCFVGNPKLLMDNNDRFEERLNTVGKQDIKRYESLKDMQEGEVFTVRMKAWLEKKTLAAKFKDIFPNAFADGEPTKKGAASGQQNAASGRATKDSKGIRTTVQGKGKTKEAALQNAFRHAVWKSVITWVDSKTRMEANHKEAIAIVETVTEADVGKYEVMSTEQQDGAFVVNAKVSVSKQKIAPKFAKLFPDVFANEVKGK